MDSLVFLERAARVSPEPIYVLHGDEDFLKRQVLAVIRKVALEGESDSFGLSTYSGDKVTFAEIRDELETLPFAGSRRLVVIESADVFITQARSLLEKYFARPAATGTLVLDVKSWPATTRLAKMVKDEATIVCKAMPTYRLSPWCIKWAASRHRKKLLPEAADLLVELVGNEMGQLDQELSKLAIFVGSANQIDVSDVDKLVGSGRVDNMWRIFDAIGGGQTGTALTILDRLFGQGEEPLRILGAFSMQLRRLAQVARRSREGQPLVRAMNEAGVPPFAHKGCEQQLRHLGPRRTEQLYDWLLEVDSGLKGSSQLPARTLLERLVVQLARSD
jgi:DNA polymerase III subunit delta